jgi:hypothetical protein
MADGAAVKKFFAKLFGKKDESGDDEESQITTVAARPVQTDDAVKTASVSPAPKASAVASAAAPLPRPRPAAIALAQQSTQVASLDDRAPLPAAITGERQEGPALGYAADSIFSQRALSAAPPPPAPASSLVPRRASVPVPATTVSIPAPKTANAELYADAAHAPASLFDSRMMQFSGEMRQQDPSITMQLAAPVRATLGTRFGVAPEQPALSRFAGPAVVELPIEFFGQSAMISGNTRAE